MPGMGGSLTRKQRTRERILASAGRVFRRKGYAGSGVDQLMREAGLTHGGFYAHFRSKEALFAEAVARALGRTVELMEKEAGDLKGVAWLRGAVSRYLSRAHVEAVQEGCPMPALVSELGRAGDAPREAFEARMLELLADVADKVPPGPGLEPEDRLLATVALCVGGVSLARAVKDPALSDRILRACRKLAVPEAVPPRQEEGPR
ncbi:MAG: TetR/AcrR family transcriptional regulator [Actinomycetota bacterium]|nr:TetR/AcrR family transcriptional regulator [Actinomycetota bacterium]MDP9487531.1 TetR/AcrR family transcriptional regulator [Actinomycetota bacterium]